MKLFQITLYEVVFRRPPTFVYIYVLWSSVDGEVEHHLRDSDEALTLLKAHLADVQY